MLEKKIDEIFAHISISIIKPSDIEKKRNKRYLIDLNWTFLLKNTWIPLLS